MDLSYFMDPSLLDQIRVANAIPVPPSKVKDLKIKKPTEYVKSSSEGVDEAPHTVKDLKKLDMEHYSSNSSNSSNLSSASVKSAGKEEPVKIPMKDKGISKADQLSGAKKWYKAVAKLVTDGKLKKEDLKLNKVESKFFDLFVAGDSKTKLEKNIDLFDKLSSILEKFKGSSDRK